MAPPRTSTTGLPLACLGSSLLSVAWEDSEGAEELQSQLVGDLGRCRSRTDQKPGRTTWPTVRGFWGRAAERNGQGFWEGAGKF